MGVAKDDSAIATRIRASMLIIKSKEVWLRDAPNIGRAFMKLNEDDTCKIISLGRFDVGRPLAAGRRGNGCVRAGAFFRLYARRSGASADPTKRRHCQSQKNPGD